MPIVIGLGKDNWNDPLNIYGGSPTPTNEANSSTPKPSLGDNDRRDLVNTIIAEAAGEGDEGMAAVANVIRNRSERRGKTPGDVVREPNQFTGYSKPGPDALKAMDDPAIRQRAESILDAVLAGNMPDQTGGADHYHADSVSPDWASAMPETARVGRHRFYRAGSGSDTKRNESAFAPGIGKGGDDPFAAVLKGETTAPKAAAEDGSSVLLSKLQAGKPDTYITDMAPGLRSGLTAMFDDAPDFVRKGLDILSGARTPEKQAQIIADNAGKYGFDRSQWLSDVNKLGPVEAGKKWRPTFRELGLTKNIGMPGGSRHQHGDAADLGWNGGAFSKAPKEVHDWVHANAGKYDLSFPMAHEPWHVETNAARSGDASAASTTTPATGSGKSIVIDENFQSNDPMGLMAGGNPFAGIADQRRQAIEAEKTATADQFEQNRIRAYNEQHNAAVDQQRGELEQQSPGRYQEIAEEDLPAFQQKWKDENQSTGLAGDTYRILKSGVIGVGQTLSSLADTVFNKIPGGKRFIEASDQIDRWLMGQTLDQAMDTAKARADASVSDRQHEGDVKNWWDEEKGWFGPAWGDPRSYLRTVGESIPATVVTMAPGGILARGAFLRTLAAGGSERAAAAAAARTATLSGMILEGGMGGADSAANVRDRIGQLPREQILATDAAKSLIEGGMSEDDAIKAVTEDAATQAFVISGVATGMFGGMGDRALAKILAEGVGGGVARRILEGAARGMVGEGLLEEGPQGAAATIAENAAVRAVDPNQSLTEGVGEAVASGVAGGGTMGGGMGAVGGAGSRRTDGAQAPESSVATADAETQSPPAPSGPVGRSVQHAEQQLSQRQAATATAPATAPAAQDGRPELGATVRVDAEGIEPFMGRVDGYEGDEAVIIDGASGEVYQIPVGNLTQIAASPERLSAENPKPTTPQPVNDTIPEFSTDPALEPQAPQGAEVRTEPLPPRSEQKPATERFPSAPNPGERVLVDDKNGGRFAARVRSYEGDEALITTDDGKDLQVPVSSLFVSKLTPKQVEKQDEQRSPPIEREKGDAGPNSRAVHGRTVVMPDDRHARLYDLGRERMMTRRTLGASQLDLNKVNNPEIQKIAEAFKVSPQAVESMADDYRYRIERAAKEARSDLPQHVAPVNERRLAQWQRERAKLEPETAAQVESASVWWDAELTAPERKRILDAAGVKRSERVMWGGFTPAIRKKLEPFRKQPKDAEQVDDTANQVDVAAHDAATSPQNELPEPTQAQKEAGNYKLGHIRLGGLDISIENPAGSERKGTDPNGKAWSVEMKSHYGYIKGTVGRDKDHIDVFVKPGTETLGDDSPVFVIDQHSGKGAFDEHKVMVGFDSADAARKGYLANYTKGWRGLGAMTPTTLGDFKKWLAEGDTSKPFAETETQRSPEERTAAQIYREMADRVTPAEFARRVAGSKSSQEAAVIEPGGKLLVIKATTNPGGDHAEFFGRLFEADLIPLSNSGFVRVSSFGNQIGASADGSLSEAASATLRALQSAATREGLTFVGEGSASKQAGQGTDNASSSAPDLRVDDERRAGASAPEPDRASSEGGAGRNPRDTAARRRDGAGTPVEPRRSDVSPSARDADADQALNSARVREVMRSKAFKAAYADIAATQMGTPHPESPVAYDLVRGWLDQKAGKPPMHEAVGSVSKNGGFDPIVPYYMGYIAARDGKAIVIRASDAEATYRDLQDTGRTIAQPAGEKSPQQKRKSEKPSLVDRLENYFRPGRDVESYGGETDRVIEFDRGAPGGWAVTVAEIREDGTLAPERIHSAAPSERLLAAWEQQNPVPQRQSPQARPEQPKLPVTENTVFTADAAEKARALLRRKLNQLNSGIDPELMQAGITLAGYHIERGARTFATYATAMIADLGDAARPYLKSWYAAMVLDPRFAGVEGMTDLSEVASADLDEILKAPSEAENLPRDSAGPSASPAETGSLNPEDRGSLSERRGERSTLRPPDVRTDAFSVPPPTATIRGNETEVQETANKVEEQGPLGPILRGYEGRWREAALELERRQDGDAIGALHHKDVGPIDLVWGRAGTNRNNGAGLSKLLAWHPEVLNDLQGFIDRLTVDQELSTPRRIQLRDETGNAALRLDFDGVAKKWLLTAFEIDNRRATPSTKTLNELWGNAGRGARTDTAPAKPSDDRTSRGTGDDNISERLKDVQSAVVPALQQPADFDEILGTVDQDKPNEVDEEGWRRSEKSSRRLADLWADQSASASPPRGNIDEDGERRNERSTDRLADIWADASSAPPPSGSIAGAASEVQQRAEGGGMDASSNNAPDAAIQLQEGSDPNAAVRSYGIPAGAASIYAYRNDNPIKASSDYTAAKAGDVAAAARLVETLAKPEMLEQVKAAFGNDVVFAAPMAEEATGRNAIPGALSWLLAAVTGATVDTDIVQSSRAYHTGARPLDRLLGRPLFSGPVRAGAKYVLVDDVSVMGGTLAEMANHIRANGGEVAGVVTLVNASRTLHIAPTKSQVKEIERRFGDVVRETFGVEPTALTGDEAYFLLNVRDADTLRDRVAKAASERERRLFQKGVRASGAEEQQEVSRGDDAIGQNDVEQPDSVRAPDPVTRTDNDLKSIPPPAREYATALYDWGRASVLDAGRRTGHEYVMAIDGDGSIIEYGSAGLPNYSGMNDKLFGAMMNRDRNVLVIHNHPKNTPLSLADIAALAHPGMHAIWAIGHDGRDTRASLTPAARDRIVGAASSVDDQLSAYARLHQALSDAYATVAGFLEKRVIDGRLSPTTGRRAAYEALPLTSRKAGVIDYFTNAEYDPTTVAGLTGVLDTAAAQLKKDVFDGEGNQGLDNGVRGSSEPVRHIGDMERLEAPTGNGRPIPGTLPLSEGSQRNDQGQDGIWSGLERENRPVKATPANILQAVRDAVTDTVADADPTILAAVPLNYFPELAKGKIPAIDDYLRVKRMMDAYRGDKHDAAAQVIDGWRGIIASKAYVTIDKGRAQQISDVMHEATLAGIDPSITTAEEMSKPGYRELRAKYTALPPKARQLFQDVRDAYREQADELDELLLDNIRKAQQIALENAEQAYKRQLEDIAAQNLNPIDRRKAEEDAASKYKSDSTRDRWRMKARMTKLRQEFEQSRVEPPYFPLARFGRYFVVAKDIDGGVLHFSRHEKKADMTFALDAIRKELPNAVIQSGVIEQNKAAREAMDPAIVAKLDEMLKDANVDESVRDALYQRYLATMPDLSMRKRQIHRKGTPGFNRDAFRVFASTMFHSAHQMARLKYGLELQENLNRAREQAQDVDDSTETMTLYNEFARRDEWVRNPTGAAVTNWITSAAFVWYMGASPAAALVNASQTVMLGVPMLGSRYGMAKASTELLKAVRQYAAGVGSFRSAALTADEMTAMDAFHRSGLIDRTQSHDLAAVGETGTKYNPIRHRVMKIVGAGFHHIEVMNRSVTALAAYRLAREAGQSHLDAINSAHERTYAIHFDMSNSSRPRLMQNDFAKVALLFRSYNINLLYRLFRDIHQSVKGESAAVRREARAQLAGAVGMMTLMAGVTGSYGYGIAMAAGAILSSLFGDDDDDLDFETRFKADVLEMLGPELGGIVLNGVPGHYLGIDLTSRIGMPDLWFRSQNRDMSGEEWWNQFLLDGLGAGAGMVGDVIRGYDIAVNEGNIARGVEIMAPKAVRDLLKTLRYAQDGVTSIRGDEILAAQDLGAADLVRQAIGFTPARIAETYDRNNALKNAEIRINENRRKIINRFAKAVEDDDDEARAAVLADVREFNAAPLHRGVVISADTLKRSLKTRARNRVKREDGVLISNEVLGRDLRDKLPETVYR